MKDEIARIRHIYNTQYRNEANDYSYIWHSRNPVSITFRHAQERAIISILNQNNIQLEDAAILDIGCGNGRLLRFLASLGVEPQNLYGIDLMDYRIKDAQLHSPSSMHFSVEDAQSLPFNENTFDMLCQFTIFSSILDKTVQKNVAQEMNRVLKPRGYILWYDMKNQHLPESNTQGINQSALIGLFPDYNLITIKSLHHRFMSRLARYSWLLGDLIDLVPGIPHTNLMALLQKPA